jgi:hypothetical protein
MTAAGGDARNGWIRWRFFISARSSITLGGAIIVAISAALGGAAG